MQAQRTFDILHYYQGSLSQAKTNSLCEKVMMGWHYISTEDAIFAMEEVSVAALQLGWKKGKRVGIFVVYTRADVLLLDLGLQQMGAIVVPLSTQFSDTDLLHILVESQVEICIVENQALYDRLNSLTSSVVSLKAIYSLEKLADVPHWTTKNTATATTQLADLQAIRASLHEDDVATIVYEKYNDALPKGFALSHKNIMTQVIALKNTFPIRQGKPVLNLLPISHLSDRVLLYTYLHVGAPIYFLPTLESLRDDLKKIRPHFASASPALIRKLYQQIQQHTKTLSSTRRRIYEWAIEIAESYPDDRMTVAYWFKWQLSSYLVFESWQRLVGNRLAGIVVNGTGLSENIVRLFNAAGLPLREAIGSALTCGWLASNRFSKKERRMGTVGLPLSSIQWILKEKGELLVKGESVGRPLESNVVQLPDGWQRTPFRAKTDDSDFLTILDTNAVT